MTPEELVAPFWRLQGGGTDGKIVRLEPDGRVHSLVNQREWSWRRVGSSLVFTDPTGREATFHPAADGTFEGAFGRGAGEPARVRLSTSGPLPAMQSLATLGLHSKTLLVVFNSWAGAFDGRIARWECFDWSAGLGVDCLRFAELGPGQAWYTDKTRRITDMLASLAPAYRQLVFFGFSAGGYASILLAELVWRRCPSTRIRTFAINPQTVHGPDHHAHITEKIGERWMPIFIMQRDLARRDCETTELPDILATPIARERLLHCIYYDDHNALEKYYAGLLRPFDRVRAFPARLGVSHLDSSLAIYETGLVQRHVAAAIGEMA